MAWSQVFTDDLMERWKVRSAVNPYSFQQVYDPTIDYSPTVWIQDERHELAQLLSIELTKFNNWVGYNPIPLYGVETVLLNDTKSWYNQNLQLSNSAYLQAFGTQGYTSIGTASITYTNDTASITITTDELDSTAELAVYPPDFAGNDLYEIHDLSISYAAGDYTITGHKSLFVDPTKQLSLDQFVGGDYKNRNTLDKDTSSNFLSNVAIYSKQNDITLQASLLSYNVTSSNIVETNVTPIILHEKNSTFRLALNSNTTTIDAIPYAVKVYYKAGYPKVNGYMFEPFETIILRQAHANFSDRIQNLIYRVSSQWQKDKEDFSNAQNYRMLMNPIGTRYIDYYTWQMYKNYHDKLYGSARFYV